MTMARHRWWWWWWWLQHPCPSGWPERKVYWVWSRTVTNTRFMLVLPIHIYVGAFGEAHSCNSTKTDHVLSGLVRCNIWDPWCLTESHIPNWSIALKHMPCMKCTSSSPSPCRLRNLHSSSAKIWLSMYIMYNLFRTGVLASWLE